LPANGLPAGVLNPPPEERILVEAVPNAALDPWKRAFDIVVTLLALVLLAPFWLTIALLIKLDSPGPVLFRQRRIGRNGEPFSMIKFRTMFCDAEERKLELIHLNEAGDGLFKIGADPRTTRFGRLLRSTSLDELPQLLNVISGQMSLVGPRPLVADDDAHITGADRVRLAVRPGMTGPWQVAGASRIPINEMVAMDRSYVYERSLWLDIKLILGTVKHMVKRRGI
jgi:lipopolysaccharide/colanic/teichoic acid biosynthesis glycosyltransferase